VVLGDVKPGGPGDIAGLQVGDLILSLDGKAMENGRQFHVNVYQRQIGDVMRLRILRGSQELDVNVAVLEREGDPGRFAEMVSREQNHVRRLGILGLELGAKLRTALPQLRKPGGVLVAARVADGPYWNALFQAADVIYAVNSTPTPGLRQLRSALDGIEEGSAVVVQIEREGALRYVSFELE
jgi:serine protease Do